MLYSRKQVCKCSPLRLFFVQTTLMTTFIRHTANKSFTSHSYTIKGILGIGSDDKCENNINIVFMSRTFALYVSIQFNSIQFNKNIFETSLLMALQYTLLEVSYRV